MRALVTGATGQLGSALLARLGDEIAWSGGRAELDLCDPDAVFQIIHEVRPDVVFNAAAYTDVDRAEAEVSRCLNVNSAGPNHLAKAAGEVGALIVHVSSDYVFDGRQAEPYAEDDDPHPLNIYGVSKLAGEQLVTASGCPYLIVRTSGLFGGDRGRSFVPRVLEQAREGEPLRIVVDQVFSPTYAPDLADALVRLVERGARGIYHVTNSGSCTWHGLAIAVLKRAGLDVSVEEIRSVDLVGAARRPAHSLLSKARFEALGLFTLRPWADALAEHLSS